MGPLPFRPLELNKQAHRFITMKNQNDYATLALCKINQSQQRPEDIRYCNGSQIVCKTISMRKHESRTEGTEICLWMLFSYDRCLRNHYYEWRFRKNLRGKVFLVVELITFHIEQT